MALGNTSSAIYLSIADGKVVRSFKQPTELSRERITKTGKVVHEEFYGFVEGMITDISIKENDWGKFWLVTITDGGESYVLQFQYSGGTAGSFLKTLPNVDLTKPVRFIPKQTIEGDKKKSSLFLAQGGVALKWFWTRDNPGELPGLEQKKVKGKIVWDDSEMMDYLESYVNNVIKPKLGAAALTPSEIEPMEDAPF
jgi:hypothetical protein